MIKIIKKTILTVILTTMMAQNIFAYPMSHFKKNATGASSGYFTLFMGNAYDKPDFIHNRNTDSKNINKLIWNNITGVGSSMARGNSYPYFKTCDQQERVHKETVTKWMMEFEPEKHQFKCEKLPEEDFLEDNWDYLFYDRKFPSDPKIINEVLPKTHKYYGIHLALAGMFYSYFGREKEGMEYLNEAEKYFDKTQSYGKANYDAKYKEIVDEHNYIINQYSDPDYAWNNDLTDKQAEKYTKEMIKEENESFPKLIAKLDREYDYNLNEIYFHKAEVYYVMEDYENAKKYYLKAIKDGKLEIFYIAESYIYLGKIEAMRGNKDKATEYLKKSMKINSQMYYEYGKDSVRGGYSVMNRSVIKDIIGRYELPREWFRELQHKHLEETNPYKNLYK